MRYALKHVVNERTSYFVSHHWSIPKVKELVLMELNGALIGKESLSNESISS